MSHAAFWIPQIGLICALLGYFCHAAKPVSDSPDIVVILADDLGFSDIGCFGGEIPTPVLDGLAEGGLRFTRFHNAARCCPTRASLLTGLYPHQAGIGHMVDDAGFEGYRGRLSEHSVTLAEVLRGAGYQTRMAGKWHVSPDPYSIRPGVANDTSCWPLQRGFEQFYGTLAGGGNYYSPVTLVRDNEALPVPDGKGFYYTDAISDAAVSFVREAEPERPMFLYLAYTAPHWPLHAPEAEIAKHLERYHKGWDVIRRERHARMVRMGILDPACPLAPRDPAVPSWESEVHKEWQVRRMATHAAMVSIMDTGIGRVMDALRDAGRLDNTVVMFLSDNGASREVIQGTKVRHGSFPRGGTRPDVMPGPADTYASFGPEWANVSNTPLRRFKKDSYEGGVATPLVVHWPRGITDRGAIRVQPGHVIDVMPTLVELAGARYPETRHDLPVIAPQGKSLVAAFRGKESVRRMLFFEHEGSRAVRTGEWTLVAAHGCAWELYDVTADRTETCNLADKHSVKVNELAAHYEDWAKQAMVRPWPLRKQKR